MSPQPHILEARGSIGATIAMAQHGLTSLAEHIASSSLGEDLEQAVDAILSAQGRLAIVGLGKSGHIGRKLAATFTSTGTPSFFLHATEASHGDLGMITQHDAMLAISWSGETIELAPVLEHARALEIPVIGMTRGKKSLLAQLATVGLVLPDVEEACPHGLAPTTSCILQLAVGDALALAVSTAKGFTVGDFHRLHPGGQLGQRLRSITELMRNDRRLPLVAEYQNILQAAVEMTAAGAGLIGVTDAGGALVGVVDGADVGRHLAGPAAAHVVTSIMDRNPLLLPPELSPADALEAMLDNHVSVAFVSADHRPLGLLYVDDMMGRDRSTLRAGARATPRN